ncbi:plasmid mobilization relaxosome protein MobC [Mucilaginibacter yixingensis]|nr:plasmid mobilization relaxosome protein MobC [Mucilaginibacter yixingensis]
MSESKSQTGRPPMPEGKRTRKIDVRFTEEEYKKVLAMERELGISKTELVRKRLLNEAGMVVVNAQALLGELDRVGTELGRAGNNINQLAHHANTLRIQGSLRPEVVSQFNDLLERYLTLQSKLEVSLRKIILEMISR